MIKGFNANSLQASDLAINAPTLFVLNPVNSSLPITSNYGGFTAELGLGFNFLTQIFPGSEDRLALEIINPIINEKNGLQMKDKTQIVFGFQKSF